MWPALLCWTALLLRTAWAGEQPCGPDAFELSKLPFGLQDCKQLRKVCMDHQTFITCEGGASHASGHLKSMPHASFQAPTYALPKPAAAAAADDPKHQPSVSNEPPTFDISDLEYNWPNPAGNGDRFKTGAKRRFAPVVIRPNTSAEDCSDLEHPM
jgi:hypothetical protein